VIDRVRYHDEVRELYLALRGSGLCLSPLDAERIDRWWREGVPLPLVLEAMREAAARHRGSGRAAARRPFPLLLADALVEERFAGYVRRSGVVPRPAPDRAGPPGAEAPPAVEENVLPRIAGSLRERAAAAPAPAAAAYLAAARALEDAAGTGERLDRLLARADGIQAVAYLRALPRDEQRRLARGAAAAAGPRGHVPRAAHRDTLRVHLGLAARRHGGLERPSELP
jgi:hypothetical protein